MSVMSQITLLSLRNKIIATTCYLSLLACETCEAAIIAP